MGPLIALPLISMVGKMVGGASDVAEATTQTAAASTAMAIFNEGTMRYHDPVTGRMVKSPDAEGETKAMFGGVSLGKIKSALDDDGSINPPEISGGPLEVNKMMLSSLQKIESTLKLMLELEHDRTEAFQQQEVQDSLTQGDTDPYIAPDDNQRGLFGRAKDMLGGVYDKAKGGFSKLGSFGKLIGLGGLLLLMGKFREDIIGAMAKTMEWFKGAYDYFTAEDFSFEKLATDFKEKFMPKLFETLNGILGSIFSYVKEAMFGASGSKRIIQEATEGSQTKTTMKTLTGKAIAGGDKLSDMRFHEAGIMKGVGSLSAADSRALHESIKDHIDVMNEISKQSGGRIQWDTFPGVVFGEFNIKNIDDLFKTHPVASFMNANPVIDGVPHSSWDILNTINLDAMAGITKDMSEDRANKIRDVLKRKTLAYQAKESQSELNAEYLALDPQIMSDMPGLKIIETDGTTDTQKTYNKVVTNVSSPMDEIRAKSSQRPLTLADQSVINNINAGTVNNVPMGAVNNLWTARLYANANTVLTNSN